MVSRKFYILIFICILISLNLIACHEIEKIEQKNNQLHNGIPFVLDDYISKHYPGRFIASVERDYFSPEYLVNFEKGTRIICEYDKSNQLNRYGFIASCNRALLPSGREINLMILHNSNKDYSESFLSVGNKNKMEFVFVLNELLTDKNIIRKKVYERSGYSIPIFIEREEKILFVPVAATGVMRPTGKIERSLK